MKFAGKLDEAYQQQAAKEAGGRGPWFPRASGIGGCLREQAHIAAGFERSPLSPESVRVFELGTQRGERLAEVAKSIWPDAVTELEVEIELPGYPLPMLGHLDVWIPSERTIIDFKTAGSFKMGLLSEGKEGAGEDYELQLQAYRHGILNRAMDMAGLFATRKRTYSTAEGSVLMGLNLPGIRCLLIFESKDSDARKGVQAGELVEVEVPYSEELELRYQDRLKALVAILKARDAKALEPTSVQGMPKGHWKCRNDEDGRPKYCSIGAALGKCHK